MDCSYELHIYKNGSNISYLDMIENAKVLYGDNLYTPCEDDEYYYYCAELLDTENDYIKEVRDFSRDYPNYVIVAMCYVHDDNPNSDNDYSGFSIRFFYNGYEYSDYRFSYNPECVKKVMKNYENLHLYGCLHKARLDFGAEILHSIK
jgi:hypothetical protein